MWHCGLHACFLPLQDPVESDADLWNTTATHHPPAHPPTHPTLLSLRVLMLCPLQDPVEYDVDLWNDNRQDRKVVHIDLSE